MRQPSRAARTDDEHGERGAAPDGLFDLGVRGAGGVAEQDYDGALGDAAGSVVGQESGIGHPGGAGEGGHDGAEERDTSSCASSSLRPTPSRFTARSAAGRRNDARVLVETDQSLCPSWPAGARPVAAGGGRPPSISWRWISARYQRRKALTRGSGGGTASSPAALSRSAASSSWVSATLVRTLGRQPHVHVGGLQAAAGRRRQLAGDNVAQRHVVGGMPVSYTHLTLPTKRIV